MKILHVITTVDVGGAEMHVLSQVRGQVARGHQVRVAYLLGHGTLRPDFLEAGAQEVACVGKSAWALVRLRSWLGWCDVVHTHLLRADMLGGLAATCFGKRRVWISGKHNDERALQRAWVGRLHGLLGRLPKRTIVLSEHVARYMQTYGRLRPDAMVVIPYGIDPTPFAEARARRASVRPRLLEEFGFPATDVVFVCVARLAPQKAHDVLIEALRLARLEQGDAPTLRLCIVGDDPFGDGMARVRGWAQAAGLLDSGACVLAGIRRDVKEILAASDVFVMPSRWEGLGLVFLEAMAADLPILATDVSAIPEVVVDGQTGLLVPVDKPEALAKAMLVLARDENLRQRLGAQGRQRVLAAFRLATMIERTLSEYEDVLAESRS